MPAALRSYQDAHLRNLPCSRIQMDEIWAFVHAKAKNVPTAKAAPEGAGDIWTWTAICADTKLVPSWLVGVRDGEYALAFIDDLRQRLANRVQLTTDGLKAYLDAVEEAFGNDIDYAVLTSSTARRQRPRSATAPRSASARSERRSPATPTRSTSARPTLSARTSPCA